MRRRRKRSTRPWKGPKEYPWWKIEAILDAVLSIPERRYSVRKVWARTREKGVSRYFVFWAEDVFEAAGVVEKPFRREGWRRVLVRDREKAAELLKRRLEQMEGKNE